MDSNLINFEKIREFLGDDKEVLKSFYDLFKEQSELDIKELDGFIQTGNGTEVSGIAHKIKSFFGNIGATSAYNLLAGIEKSGKEEPDFGKIQDLFKQFLEIHKSILEEIDRYLSI